MLSDYIIMDVNSIVIARITVVVISFFFFFQAEDGIRDLTVTGVQTCALPICAEDRGDRGSRQPQNQLRRSRRPFPVGSRSWRAFLCQPARRSRDAGR